MTGIECILLASVISLALVMCSLCLLVFRLTITEKENHREEIRQLHAILKTTMNRLQARNPSEYAIMESTDRSTVESAFDPSDQGEARAHASLLAQEFNG